MVKPPLRTKSIGFKVSEEEYAQLETAAQTSGRTLGRVVPRGGAGECQRCREARPGAGRDRGSAPAARKRVGATGGGREDDAGRVQPTAGSNQRNQAPARSQVAAAGERETAARKTQRREAVIPIFSLENVRSAGAASSLSASLRPQRGAPRTCGLDPAPSPLLCCFQLGKNVK